MTIISTPAEEYPHCGSKNVDQKQGENRGTQADVNQWGTILFRLHHVG